MAIRLFLKHLFTSIKRRPAQPVLLILVLAIAVLASITTINIGDYIEQNQDGALWASYGKADYSVTVNSVSEVRFISVNDVYNNIEGVDACGTYALPMITDVKRDFVYGVSTDFAQANEIFEFTFSDSTPLPENMIMDAIYVTEEFAEKYNVKVGDKVRMGFLGFEKNYYIYGISPTKFINEYDVMVDIKSMVKMIASDSLFLALVQEDYMPANKIYVNTHGNADVVKKLAELFPDDTVAASTLSQGNGLIIMDEIMLMMILISVFFVIIVIYCCFNIISLQRQEENRLFYAVGSKQYMLNALSMFEVAFYWLIGSIIGFLCSNSLGEFIIRVSGMEYCTVKWNVEGILISAFCMLVAAEASMLLFIATENFKKKRSKAKKKTTGKNFVPFLGFMLIAVTACMMGIMYKLPIKSRVAPGLIGYFSLVTSAFLFGKELFQKLAKKLSGSKKLPLHTRYALKNSYKIGTLANSSSMIGLLLIVLSTVILLIYCCNDSVERCENFLTGDYLVVNAPEDAEEILLQEDNIENVYRIYSEYTPRDYKNICLMGGTDLKAFSKSSGLNKLPTGNKCVVSGIYAEEYNLEIGDSLKVVLGSKTLKLVVDDIIESNGPFIYIDNEYWDIPYTYTLVDGKEGVDSEELYQTIASSLAMESVSIVDKGEYLSSLVTMNHKYIICATFIIVIIAIFGSIGLADSVAASYRSRREEFACFKAAGMGKASLFRMKSSELIYSLLIGVLIFCIYFPFIFYVVYMTGKGFCINILWSY